MIEDNENNKELSNERHKKW